MLIIIWELIYGYLKTDYNLKKIQYISLLIEILLSQNFTHGCVLKMLILIKMKILRE